MKFEVIIEKQEYLERVIKHFRLPLRPTTSKKKFDSYLKFLKKVDPCKLEQIVSITEKDFNKLVEDQGTEEPDFSFESIVDLIVSDFSNTKQWGEFLEKDYSNSLEGYEGVTSTHGLYTKENDGKNFVSIDLVSANWQSLQTIIGFDNNYEDLVKTYSDYTIPVISKTFRTKISGVMSAKKIMEFNKHLLRSNQYNILKVLHETTGINFLGREPFAFYADEFLIELTDEELDTLQSLDLSESKALIKQETNVNVHIRPFKLIWMDIEKACIKKHKDSYDIINISKDILFLIDKIIHGVEIEKIDFEKVKLGKLSEEEYIAELKCKLNHLGLI